MATPYYLNDTVTMSFQITNAFGDAAPSTVTVDVFDPSGTKRINNASGTVANTNEISYTVDQDDGAVNTTNIAGDYTSFFEIVFDDSTRRTHKVTFTVTTRDL